MDAFAFGLKVAQSLIASGDIDSFVDARYSSYTNGIGKKIADKATSLAELSEYALQHGEPKPQSGRQEMLESILNTHIMSLLQ